MEPEQISAEESGEPSTSEAPDTLPDRYTQQHATNVDSNPDEERRVLGDEYRKGTLHRIVAKSMVTGSAAVFLVPCFNARTIPSDMILGGLNTMAFMAFYDIVREAFTVGTLTDTPLSSAVAGGLSGAHLLPA